MRTLLPLVLVISLSFATTGPLPALGQNDLQASQGFVGIWEGTPADPSYDRELTRLYISRAADGGLTGSVERTLAFRLIDGTDVSTRTEQLNLSLRNVRVEGQTMAFSVQTGAEPGFNVSYQGTLSSDGVTLVGTSRWLWKDADRPPLPATLHRVVEPGGTRLAAAELPYREGLYSVWLIPGDVTRSSLATRTGCDRWSGDLRVQIALAREGDDWVGRTAPPEGNLVVRLRRASGSPLQGWLSGVGSHRVVGSITGMATNAATRGPFDDKGRRVSLSSEAMIEGGVASGFISDGLVIGEVIFTGSNGTSVKCAPGSVSWWMTGPDPA